MRKRALSHLDDAGRPRMVDVGGKAVSVRMARARSVLLLPEACRAVLAQGGDTAKGNVLTVARLAGIMAAKRTADLIPLCHPLALDQVAVDADLRGGELHLTATVRCRGRTGVEMEALTAASVAALTAYDMLKALSHDLVIARTELLDKRGGRSGTIRRRPT